MFSLRPAKQKITTLDNLEPPGRRCGIDVKGLSSQGVYLIGQAHFWGGTDRRRVGTKSHASNGRNREEGGDPPRDCASS
jgi:hypothetical protein